jgi:hypothetical protein
MAEAEAEAAIDDAQREIDSDDGGGNIAPR